MSVASVGTQAGIDASEVVMMIQTHGGLERFYGSGTVRLGVDAGLTLGPWGAAGVAVLDPGADGLRSTIGRLITSEP
jgi:lipid-binding SYLF domain-containing protein